MTVEGGFRQFQATPKPNQDSSPPPEGTSFWQTTSLDELIRIQGVATADNLDEISLLWPQEDDPDELLHFIEEERKNRRGNMR